MHRLECQLPLESVHTWDIGLSIHEDPANQKARARGVADYGVTSGGIVSLARTDDDLRLFAGPGGPFPHIREAIHVHVDELQKVVPAASVWNV
jgi:hypothetical protein